MFEGIPKTQEIYIKTKQQPRHKQISINTCNIH